MKYIWTCIMGLFLTACGSGQEASIASQVVTILRGNDAADGAQVTAAALRSVITPEMVAQTGGGILVVELPARDATAALGRVGVNKDVNTFLTPDGVSISTRRGMIVATRGLGQDLMTADVQQPLAALQGQRREAVRIHQYLDGENQVISRSFRCQYTQTSAQAWSETCETTNFSFENKYLLGPSGRITDSTQWLSPTLGYITTAELLQ